MEYEQYRLQKGKSNLRLLTTALVGLPVMNIAVSFLSPISIGPMVTQSLTLLISIVFAVLIHKGRPIRWYLFAWFILSAFGMFFLGGQRMVFKGQDGGLTAMFSVMSGMILIGCAVYLGGSDEIAEYVESINPDRGPSEPEA